MNLWGRRVIDSIDLATKLKGHMMDAEMVRMQEQTAVLEKTHESSKREYQALRGMGLHHQMLADIQTVEDYHELQFDINSVKSMLDHMKRLIEIRDMWGGVGAMQPQNWPMPITKPVRNMVRFDYTMMVPTATHSNPLTEWIFTCLANALVE
jgi:hypothetical protein